MFASEGVQIAPSTLAHLFKNGAQSLKVLYDRMVKLIMQCEVLHVDETFLKLAVPGHGKCKTAYFWCRMTGIGPPMVAFHFSPSRSQDVAQLLLGDYSGTIIRDSYVGYEKLSCEAACCWAHYRRRVFDAHKAGFVKSAQMLDMIRDLYRIERIAKDKAEAKGTETALFQARKIARRDSRKIVDDIFALCREWQQNELPSSPLAKAATYALNIENELKKFLYDPKLNLDNNVAESQMRRIAIGRRSWLFTGSETGGQNLVILFSFAATLCIKSDFLAQFNEDLGQLEYFNAFFNKNRTFQINQLHLPPQTFCDVEKELQDLHVIIHSDRPCRLLAIRLSLLRFLLAVFDGGFKGWKQTGTSLNEQLFRSIADLEAHPTQHFSLVNMAEKAHMSISAYAHKFKELVGVSPGEYSLLLRLDLSKKILESTTLPCKEIAFHAGFNDCNYFIRAFKKRFGVTPKCYRSQRQIIL